MILKGRRAIETLRHRQRGMFAMGPTFFASGAVAGSTVTWDPAHDDSDQMTLTNGNLTIEKSTGTWSTGYATGSAATGKRYYEIVYDEIDTGPGLYIPGVCKAGVNESSYLGSDTLGWGFQVGLFRTVHNATFPAYGASAPTAIGTVIGILLNLTTGDLNFYINGSDEGVAYSSLSGTFFPAIALNTMTATARFNAASWGTTPSGAIEW